MTFDPRQAALMTTIEEESDRFVRAIELADPAAPVPTCPDWTADDLLWHLTEVHAFWAGILATGALTDAEVEAVEAAKPDRPGDRGTMLALFRDQTSALLAQLTARDDAEPAWFWLDTDHSVGATRRMQAHEAVMHRIDAEMTAGVDSAPIAPDIAWAGVRHAVEVMWAWWGTVPGFEFTPAGGVVSLVATDIDGEYAVQPGRWRGVGESGKSYDVAGIRPAAATAADGAAATAADDAAATAADGAAASAADAGLAPIARLTGTAEELDRWLWSRGPEPAASGDTETLEALRAGVAEGMQ